MRTSFVLSGVTGAALFAASSVDASTLSRVNSSDLYDGGGKSVISISGPRDASDFNAGGFRITDSIEAFIGWCLDVGQSISLPAEYTATDTPFSETTGTLDADRVTAIEDLFEFAFDYVDLDDDASSAGFQVALWEVLYETETDFNAASGYFQQTASDAVNDAANYFLSLLGAGETRTEYDITYWESASSQNLITAKRTPVIPLPASIFLLGGGLAALGLARRRRGA